MEKSGKQVPPSSSAQSLLDSNLDEPSSSNAPSTSAENRVERSQNLFTNQSPSLFMRFMNLGISGEQLPESSQSHSHEEAENAVDVKGTDQEVEQKNDGEGQDEIDRMSDDGYPLVMDFGHSERQSRMAKQRLIEQVIQEQGQAFEQDVMEELENANSRHVFDPIEEGEGSSTERPANALNHDGMAFTPRVEAAIAHYMVRKYADGGNAARSLDASGSVAVDGISVEPPPPPPPEDEPSSSSMDAPPVNILPASRNLPMSNFIAIGRRPFRTNKNRRPVANSRGDSSSLGWQATKPSLKDRLGYMFCNEVLADVYFIVGKDEQRQRIPAHKFVLSIGSVVFDAMFNGGLTPSNSRDPLEIELPDVEPPAFLTLLRFLYSDEVNIGPESVMTTLYTAKKYAVPAMETACVEFLKQSLGADNAFMLLTQARLFDEPQLEQLCLELIDKNTHEALGGEGFSEIDLSTLCVVLARDTLRITEAPLFQAVVRWATEECVRRGLEPNSESKRSVLGSALHLIRFPLMTVEEFAQTAAQSGLLSDREVVNLFLYFTVNPKPSTSFNDRPRCAIAGKELVVGRFQRNEVRWGYSGMPDRIKFTVDRKIYVIGFGLYGGIVGPYEYPCTIQIIHCGTGKVMATNDTTFVCDGSSSTFRVLFRDPVEITPSVTYIASAYIKGPDTHYGTKGLRRIVHQSNSGGSVTFQFTYAAGNNNGTSVEDGQIPEIIFYSKLV